uniref:Wall-associated receptor kinase 3 n=1 Tax=Aegilops tauschii TaxID=37682 RepID=M8B1P3_AEGTA
MGLRPLGASAWHGLAAQISVATSASRTRLALEKAASKNPLMSHAMGPGHISAQTDLGYWTSVLPWASFQHQEQVDINRLYGLAMVVGQAKGKNQLEYLTADSCISYCMDISSIGNGTECSGTGCCRAPVSGNINAFGAQSVPVSAIYNSTIQSFSPCTYSFVAEDDWFKFDRSYINSTNFGRKYTDGVPLVLDWVVGNGSCSETSKMGSQYACQAMNSECIDVSNGPGYRCNCSQGYEGNPYLQGGCKDINECEPPNQSLYPCKGFRSDDPKSIPCVQADPNKALKVALGTSAGVVFLMVCMFALQAEYQKRKLAKEKERFFDQNGGQILYHQIMSKQVDTLMIFTQEDLKKATNDFDESREVGRGGHGTVYKGVLKDGRRLSYFHRPTTGMWSGLEVEVPILVYEFIPNGTLFEFIHRNRGTPPPSLDTRLRAAQESAEALAYLHLSMNRPIVHGDVKSMNILLDENYMAKVTDFGASRTLPKNEVQFMTLVQGTLGYLDPEYLQERQLMEKSDVYSFGIVLLELITGKTAIYHDVPKEVKSLASSFLLVMKEESLDGILDASILSAGMETLLREVAELARMCLSTRGEERPSMTQVADKLKALRSTWREKFLLMDDETERLVSAPAALAFHDPLSSIMFSTGPRMSGIVHTKFTQKGFYVKLRGLHLLLLTVRFRILEGMDGTDRPPEPGEYAVPAIESGAPSTPTMEVEAAGGDTQAQLVVAALGPPAASQQATGKVNPEAPEWKKRVRVGSAAPGRTPCPTRASALENAIRSFADNPGDEAYDFYNVFSWEKGFGIRYGKGRLNVERTKCMQEIVCGYAPVLENTRSCRCNCPVLIRLLRLEDNGWYIVEHREKHNHSLSPNCGETIRWPSHKRIEAYNKDLGKQLKKNIFNLSKIYSIIGSFFGSMEKAPFTKQSLKTLCGKLGPEQ